MTPTVLRLTKLFGKEIADDIWRLSKKTDRLETIWAAKMRRNIEATTTRVLQASFEKGELDTSAVDFTLILMRHAQASLEDGITSADRSERRIAKLSSAPPDSRIPRTLEQLRKWWDRYRKGKVPKRQADLAKKLAREYLDRLHKAWAKHSEPFLAGDTFDNTAASSAIRQEAGVTKSRADMIVATETTYNFNKARREIFDQSPDVTHYFFAAIRDHRTTKWCATRDGLVYTKGTPLLEQETPPIHWQCRSDILPLSPKNPYHMKLIDQLSRRREVARPAPEPLSKEWTT